MPVPSESPSNPRPRSTLSLIERDEREPGFYRALLRGGDGGPVAASVRLGSDRVVVESEGEAVTLTIPAGPPSWHALEPWIALGLATLTDRKDDGVEIAA